MFSFSGHVRVRGMYFNLDLNFLTIWGDDEQVDAPGIGDRIFPFRIDGIAKVLGGVGGGGGEYRDGGRVDVISKPHFPGWRAGVGSACRDCEQADRAKGHNIHRLFPCGYPVCVPAACAV